jgi:hypothetical protein
MALGSIKTGIFFYQVRNYQLFMKKTKHNGVSWISHKHVYIIAKNETSTMMEKMFRLKMVL